MRIVCDKCNWVIDKDKYVDGVLVEEYENTFGTSCPNCYHTIRPLKQPFQDKKRDKKLKILQEEMREKLRLDL
jgi:NAD-dependent SIR2 family protein deacetylase